MAGAGRTMVLSSTFGNFSMLVIFVLGGFVISKGYHIILKYQVSVFIHTLIGHFFRLKKDWVLVT